MPIRSSSSKQLSSIPAQQKIHHINVGSLSIQENVNAQTLVQQPTSKRADQLLPASFCSFEDRSPFCQFYVTSTWCPQLVLVVPRVQSNCRGKTTMARGAPDARKRPWSRDLKQEKNRATAQARRGTRTDRRSPYGNKPEQPTRDRPLSRETKSLVKVKRIKRWLTGKLGNPTIGIGALWV